MKRKLKQATNYLFTFVPVIVFTGFLSFTYKPIKEAPKKAPVTESLGADFPLPCGFPNHGYVPHQTPQITPDGTYPLLVYPSQGPPASHPIYDNIGSEGGGYNNLRLQSDGNLVLYELISGSWKACWSTQTAGSGATSLWFQNDGNLVLKNSSGGVVWNTYIHTTCSGGSSAFFVFQSDGNLVMRYPAGHVDGGTQLYDYALGDTNTQLGHVSSHQGTIQ